MPARRERHFEETPRRVYGLVKGVNRPEADAVFISGVGLPTLSVLGAAEADLGKPVLSSACAMLWNALRVAGVGTPIPGYGRLLQDTKYRPAWVPSEKALVLQHANNES